MTEPTEPKDNRIRLTREDVETFLSIFSTVSDYEKTWPEHTTHAGFHHLIAVSSLLFGLDSKTFRPFMLDKFKSDPRVLLVLLDLAWAGLSHPIRQLSPAQKELIIRNATARPMTKEEELGFRSCSVLMSQR